MTKLEATIQYEPQQGEIVMVRNEPPEGKGQDRYYVQKFVVRHNGIFYCERDDGKPGLVGWKYLIKNQGHKYHGRPTVEAFDDHYIKPPSER